MATTIQHQNRHKNPSAAITLPQETGVQVNVLVNVNFFAKRTYAPKPHTSVLTLAP